MGAQFPGLLSVLLPLVSLKMGYLLTQALTFADSCLSDGRLGRDARGRLPPASGQLHDAEPATEPAKPGRGPCRGAWRCCQTYRISCRCRPNFPCLSGLELSRNALCKTFDSREKVRRAVKYGGKNTGEWRMSLEKVPEGRLQTGSPQGWTFIGCPAWWPACPPGGALCNRPRPLT